jgi:hypothetical protein
MRIIGKQRSDTITATEIATAVYCLEQWRLQYGLGLEPANRKALAAGTRHPRRKAMAEQVAGMFIALGRVLSPGASKPATHGRFKTSHRSWGNRTSFSPRTGPSV